MDFVLAFIDFCLSYLFITVYYFFCNFLVLQLFEKIHMIIYI